MEINSIIVDPTGNDDEMEDAGMADTAILTEEDEIRNVLGELVTQLELKGGGEEEMTEAVIDSVENIFPFINPNPKLRKNEVDFYASVIWSQRYNKEILDYVLKPISKQPKKRKTILQKKQMKEMLKEISLRYEAAAQVLNTNEHLNQFFATYCFEIDRTKPVVSEDDRKLKYSIFVALKENNYDQKRVDELIDDDLIIPLNDPRANEKNRLNPQTSISWGLPFTKDDSDSQFSVELFGNLYKIFRGIDEDGYIPKPPNQTLWTTTRSLRVQVFYKYFWRDFEPVLKELMNTLPEHQSKNPILKKVLLFVWFLPKTETVKKEFELKKNYETNVTEDVPKFPIFKRMGLIGNLGEYKTIPPAIIRDGDLDPIMTSQMSLICKVIAKGLFEFINQLILCACNFNPEPLYGLVWEEKTKQEDHDQEDDDVEKEINIHENLIPKNPGNFFRIPWSAYRTMPFEYKLKPELKINKLEESNFVSITVEATDMKRKFYAINPQRGNISRYFQAYRRVLNNMKDIFELNENRTGTTSDSLLLNLSQLEITNDKDPLSREISEKLSESIIPTLRESYKYACDDYVQKFELTRKNAKECREDGEDDQDNDKWEQVPKGRNVAAEVEIQEEEEKDDEMEDAGDATSEAVTKGKGKGKGKEQADPTEHDADLAASIAHQQENGNPKRKKNQTSSEDEGEPGASSMRAERPKKPKKKNFDMKWKKIKDYLLNLKF